MLRPITIFSLGCLLLSGVKAEEEVDRLESMIEKACGGSSGKKLIKQTIPLRTHSIAPPYVDSDLQNRWWDFGGDAIINTNKHIRLTQDKASQSGYLWSRMPITVTNWQLDFEFKVDGKAHILYGDGFALWITKDRAQQGPVFGSVDYFTGLGVFFDTYANTRHAYQFPRVTAMMGDGKTAYDLEGDNAAHEIAACSENFRRRDVTTRARLIHIRGEKLQLKLQTKKTDEWQLCFEVDVNLPEAPYIGFTALTGDVADDHDIVQIQAQSLVLRKEFRDQQQAPMIAGQTGTSTGRTRPEQKKGKDPRSSGGGGAAGWFLFILKIIGLLAFVAFAVAAFRTYSAQKKSKRAW